MSVYIRSQSDGRYVGDLFGLAFFETATLEINKIKPAEFQSVEQTQKFLDSWVGGPSDCFVSVE
jgi:hypothetical protein